MNKSKAKDQMVASYPGGLRSFGKNEPERRQPQSGFTYDVAMLRRSARNRQRVEKMRCS
jgi:hypothetical protein